MTRILLHKILSKSKRWTPTSSVIYGCQTFWKSTKKQGYSHEIFLNDEGIEVKFEQPDFGDLTRMICSFPYEGMTIEFLNGFMLVKCHADNAELTLNMGEGYNPKKYQTELEAPL